MIKVQNNLEKASINPLCEVINDQDVINELYSLGIDLGEHESYDFIFEYANELKEVKPSTIAFERIDGPQIKHRALLKQDNLIALVKMYVYRDIDVQNQPCIDGRPFTTLIGNPKDFVEPEIKITEQDMKKVYTGPNFMHYKRLSNVAKELERIGEQERDIDVSFAGTVEYGKNGHKSGKLIGDMRKKACDIIELMGKNGYKVDVVRGRNIGRREYLERLLRSKVVVSPWGWGEACYRDYEATLAGCDIIKPNSYIGIDGLESVKAFTCNSDMSNLRDVVEGRVTCYGIDWLNRVMLSTSITKSQTPQYIAKILAEIINNLNNGE
jgi:hypothetical protein